MRIQTIATGSTGNAYFVEIADYNILLDCGITLDALQKWCWEHDERVMRIDAILLTHEHQDHAKSAQNLLDCGLRLYTSNGTAQALGLRGGGLEICKSLKPCKFEDLQILPFDTVHDSAEPLGFVISAFNENLLYVTDTAYIKYRFNNLTHIIAECNHTYNGLTTSVQNGVVNEFLAKRVVQNHMSLETLKKWLTRCDKSMLQEIYLCHLSDNNAEADKMKQEIQAVTGVPVYIC